MVVGAKVCELTEDLLWFVCGLYVGILTSSQYFLTLYSKFVNNCNMMTRVRQHDIWCFEIPSKWVCRISIVRQSPRTEIGSTVLHCSLWNNSMHMPTIL